MAGSQGGALARCCQNAMPRAVPSQAPAHFEKLLMVNLKTNPFGMARWLPSLALVCSLALVRLAYGRADIGDKLPLLQVGQDYYTNVTVTGLTATDVYFSHSQGLGNAKLRKLDPKFQAMFNFDPVQAADKERAQAQANALYKQAVRSAPTVTKPAAGATDIPGQPATVGEEMPASQLTAKSFLNQPAPLITADKWLTTAPNLTGKFVILDFWATWCAPCRKSIPHLNTLADKFKERLVVIGLSDETEEAARKLTEPQINYYVAVDTQHRSSTQVGLTAIPHALLIDPKGIVRFEGHPLYLTDAKLEKLMAQYGGDAELLR